MRVAVVANPTSGKGQGARVTATTVARLRKHGLEVRDVSASTAAAAAHQARAAVQAGVDALVVVGGDGMVHLGVNACAGTRVPLAVVPAGSGNDCARGLRLPLGDAGRAVDVAVGLLRGGAWRTVDAGRVRTADGTERWFLGVLSAGFDALVNERANGWTWPRGRMRYNIAIARELPGFRPMRYLLTLDDEKLDHHGMLVSLANGTSFGGGMKIAPEASWTDGLLDVVVLGPVSTPEFVRVFPTVFSGRHLRHPAVSVRRARTVGLETPDRVVVVYADGERVGPTPLRCEVVPAAVRVLTPAGPGDPVQVSRR